MNSRPAGADGFLDVEISEKTSILLANGAAVVTATLQPYVPPTRAQKAETGVETQTRRNK